MLSERMTDKDRVIAELRVQLEKHASSEPMTGGSDEGAFLQLKDRLVSPPVLAYPNLTRVLSYTPMLALRAWGLFLNKNRKMGSCTQ